MSARTRIDASAITWTVTVKTRNGSTTLGVATGAQQLGEILTDARVVYRTEGTTLALSCSHHGVGQVLREVWDGTHWRPIVEGGAS